MDSIIQKSNIINPIYCKQCGACVGVCKKNAIDYTIDPHTGLMQLFINQEKCVQCGNCHRVCSGVEDFSLLDVSGYASEKSYYIGYSANDDIRRNASSGGVSRTIIIEGLKTGLFDGVYTLRKIDNYPFVEGCVYTKVNIPTYEEIPNSVYHSVPAAMNLSQIKDFKNLLIVGTTCQLYALRKYAEKKCENVYSLCIFCKQQKTFESSQFIAKLAGVKLDSVDDIKTFAYRGNGWPGYCMFNGKTVAWGIAALMPFGKKLWSVPGCDVCGNPFGENVDLTVLDPWIINKKNDKGANIVVVHNESGKKILDLIPQIKKEKIEYDKVKPALMLADIEKKNKFISYFRGKEESALIIQKGDAFIKQRQNLSSFLNKTPKFPLIVYKILAKLIKDKR